MTGQERESNPSDRPDEPNRTDVRDEGKREYELDIDRMVNEGLGGGMVTMHNGLIEDTTAHTMTGQAEEGSDEH